GRVPQDHHKAFRWFQRAAKKEDVDGLYSLGRCYYLGQGVDKDQDQAMVWFAKAAAKGHAESQRILDLYWGNIIQSIGPTKRRS
ncbi:MAG TPA: tetratricopeptide repeat protein, partial [Rhabdochlamydiaceae bacterium]|nr:tetratricopeptide repeat protein [Rhabdochlamydiaceae bacterium]